MKLRQKIQGENISNLSVGIEDVSTKLSFFKENFGKLGEQEFTEGIAEAIEREFISAIKKERESFVQEIKYHDEQVLKTIRSIPADMRNSIPAIIENEIKNFQRKRSVFRWAIVAIVILACVLIIANLVIPTEDKYKLK